MFISNETVAAVKKQLDVLVTSYDVKVSYDMWQVETMLRDVLHQDPFLKYKPSKAAVAVFLSYFFTVERTDPDYKTIFNAFCRALANKSEDLYVRYEEYRKLRELCIGGQFACVKIICRRILDLSEQYDSAFYTFFINFWLWVKNHKV